ncbi:hypothetical protein Bbelb_223780 [Branchiostoma belcheri]|nr:hypothetical protein Bbelb_223780 [Branchiostoma belcheri]
MRLQDRSVQTCSLTACLLGDGVPICPLSNLPLLAISVTCCPTTNVSQIVAIFSEMMRSCCTGLSDITSRYSPSRWGNDRHKIDGMAGFELRTSWFRVEHSAVAPHDPTSDYVHVPPIVLLFFGYSCANNVKAVRRASPPLVGPRRHSAEIRWEGGISKQVVDL